MIPIVNKGNQDYRKFKNILPYFEWPYFPVRSRVRFVYIFILPEPFIKVYCQNSPLALSFDIRSWRCNAEFLSTRAFIYEPQLHRSEFACPVRPGKNSRPLRCMLAVFFSYAQPPFKRKNHRLTGGFLIRSLRLPSVLFTGSPLEYGAAGFHRFPTHDALPKNNPSVVSILKSWI